MWFQAELLDNTTSLPTTHLLFNLSLLNSSNPYNQLRLTYGCKKDEQIYGFGAQYSKFNVKGQRLPLFLSEQGVGRGIEPLTLALNLASPGAGTPFKVFNKIFPSNHKNQPLEHTTNMSCLLF